jgi:uncharacterized protein
MSEGKMFKEMRRQDRKLDRAETDEILKNGSYGVLSTVDEGNCAYGIPLNYVYMRNGIYVHCASEGQKLDNIRKNNKVSFCVVGEAFVLVDQFSMKYKSVIVSGNACEVDGDEKFEVLIALVAKYSSDEYLEKGREYAVSAFEKTTVIKIDIETITGKARR